MSKAEIVVVAQAEKTDALPGMAQIVSALAGPIQNAHQKHIEAKLSSWDIMRQIYEFALNPIVVQRLKEINHHPDGRVKEGRPKQAHRLLMDELVRSKKCSERTLNRWQGEWLEVARKLKIETGCSKRTFEGLLPDSDIGAWIDKLLESDEESGGGSGGGSSKSEPWNPEDAARQIVEDSFQNLLYRKMSDGTLTPRIVGKKESHAFAKTFNRHLSKLGIRDWELLFVTKE